MVQDSGLMVRSWAVEQGSPRRTTDHCSFPATSFPRSVRFVLGRQAQLALGQRDGTLLQAARGLVQGPPQA